MNTPICDFVRRYGESHALRLHMPGHKGQNLLGMEHLDITEIAGADSLYEASGIIRESEENASRLFGCATFYSTEGSSLCIRAMLHLVLLYAKAQGKKPLIAAARNVHKTFLSAAALLDMDVLWLYGQGQHSYLSCILDADSLDAALSQAAEKPVAVYITSPDYTGSTSDIARLSAVCRRHGVLLAVDNAHGAYLRFLPESLHPMDLGADICCDSAHKTLPVLTGGAYLHISSNAPEILTAQAKNALALFGSTSPSYLILQSLDMANAYLSDSYREKLQKIVEETQLLKEVLTEQGYRLLGNEPLKLTLLCKPYGYNGGQMAQLLLQQGAVCEFADPDILVMMITPETGSDGLQKLKDILLSIPIGTPLPDTPPAFHRCEKIMSIRQATLSPQKTVSVEESIGKVLASPSVGCPPAVPIAVCGERIDADTADIFRYYGIESCSIVV